MLSTPVDKDMFMKDFFCESRWHIYVTYYKTKSADSNNMKIKRTTIFRLHTDKVLQVDSNHWYNHSCHYVHHNTINPRFNYLNLLLTFGCKLYFFHIFPLHVFTTRWKPFRIGKNKTYVTKKVRKKLTTAFLLYREWTKRKFVILAIL